MLLLSFISISAQSNLEEHTLRCLSKRSNKAKYKVLSFGRGAELQIDLQIGLKHHSDEDLIATANEIKEMYCRDQEIRITYFKSKESWSIIDPNDIKSMPLAIYYLNRARGEEGIHFYSVINSKVKTRIVNFSLKNDPF